VNQINIVYVFEQLRRIPGFQFLEYIFTVLANCFSPLQSISGVPCCYRLLRPICQPAPPRSIMAIFPAKWITFQCAEIIAQWVGYPRSEKPSLLNISVLALFEFSPD